MLHSSAGDLIVVATTTLRMSSTDVHVETPSPGPPLALPDGGQPSLVAIARDVREHLADEDLLRQQGEQLAVAEDLADMVIQHMFAAGLALDATIRLVDEPGLAERLGLVADELDAAIRDLRGAIFGLTYVDQRSGYSGSDELGGEDG